MVVPVLLESVGLGQGFCSRSVAHMVQNCVRSFLFDLILMSYVSFLAQFQGDEIGSVY
jgi:hypothetical protein